MNKIETAVLIAVIVFIALFGALYAININESDGIEEICGSINKVPVYNPTRLPNGNAGYIITCE